MRKVTCHCLSDVLTVSMLSTFLKFILYFSSRKNQCGCTNYIFRIKYKATIILIAVTRFLVEVTKQFYQKIWLILVLQPETCLS